MKTLTNELAQAKDYNDLFAKLNDAGLMLSTIMMDMTSINPLKLTEHPDARKWELERFIHYCQLTEVLGQLEHTGDWDPCITIILDDDTAFFSPSGYSDMTMDLEDLIISGPDELEEEDETQFWNSERKCWIIPISRIKTINLNPSN